MNLRLHLAGFEYTAGRILIFFTVTTTVGPSHGSAVQNCTVVTVSLAAVCCWSLAHGVLAPQGSDAPASCQRAQGKRSLLNIHTAT